MERELGENKHVENTAYQAGRPFLVAAQAMGIAIEFNFVQQSIEKVNPAILQIYKDEAVLVYAGHYLYSLSDSSVLRHSPRDAAIAAI